MRYQLTGYEPNIALNKPSGPSYGRRQGESHCIVLGFFRPKAVHTCNVKLGLFLLLGFNLYSIKSGSRHPKEGRSVLGPVSRKPRLNRLSEPFKHR